MFLDSLMQLKENGINISLKTLQSNKIKLVTMMAGFVLNLIGIYVLSITHQVINPNSSPTGSVLHPLLLKLSNFLGRNGHSAVGNDLVPRFSDNQNHRSKASFFSLKTSKAGLINIKFISYTPTA